MKGIETNYEIIKLEEKLYEYLNKRLMIHIHSNGLIFRSCVQVNTFLFDENGFELFDENSAMFNFSNINSIKETYDENENYVTFMLNFNDDGDKVVYLDFI